MNAKDYKHIPKEKFELVRHDERIFDAKFETKPIGYLQDAWIRFKRNKASVFASYLLMAVVIFAAIVPLFSKYKLEYSDAVYAKARPKLMMFERSGFWDGSVKRKYNDRYLIYTMGIGFAAENPDGDKQVTWQEAMDSKYRAINRLSEDFEDTRARYRYAYVDSYYMVGFKYLSITQEEFDQLRAWETEHGERILYPLVDTRSQYAARNDADANEWYKQKNGRPVDNDGKRMKLEDVKAQGLYDNYLRDDQGNAVYTQPSGKTMLKVRVLNYNYYKFVNGYEPASAFGLDGNGNDILVRMAHGIRLSLFLAFTVAIINFFIGTIYGSISGFYGGWTDLLMERVKDILAGMPFIIVAVLFQYHLVQTGKVGVFGGLVFAFVLTGWIGISSRVRTQFYRFKHHEYVLAARTLGAKDSRLMFKHILPNAIGTIITSVALIIPGIIYSESILSYLGIVQFHGKTQASLGTMLGTGQGFLQTDPHILFFPAVVLSIMMISFNLFGNGLRDAFNPSLRGVED